MLIAYFPETKTIAKNVARALKAKASEIVSQAFPDGESYIRLKDNPENKTVVIISSMVHEPNVRLVETALTAQAARENKAKKVILVATYLPYMRQDKQFNKYEAVSSNYLKNFLGLFDKSFIIDPHLHRIHSMKQLEKNSKEITTNPLIADYVKKHFKDYELVGPDKESFQWAKEIADSINLKSTILEKRRFSSFKVKIGYKKLGKRVLLIDDIISTGRTIVETIKMARKNGAKKIAVIGIHAVFSGEAERIIRLNADELILTNTIPNKFAKIDVSPIISQALSKYK